MRKFKLNVNNKHKFYMEVQDSIRGWMLEFDKVAYSTKSYLGDEDIYARDLSEYSRDLPEFAKQVCGLYVYMKYRMSGSNVSLFSCTMASNNVDVKTTGVNSYRADSVLTDKLYSGIVYAKNLPEFAKDLPVNARDACFTTMD